MNLYEISRSVPEVIAETDKPVRRIQSLAECVEHTVNDYFRDLDGEQPMGMYEMVMHEVERPLLETVLRQADSNQSQAARLLGINRATLRKKLQFHGLL